MNTTTQNKIEFTRINSDVNGNPRYVCHFLAFINNETSNKFHSEYGLNAISKMYEFALQQSRQLGGRKFHNKQYGGGIVFQMYDGQKEEMSDRINQIKNSFK